MEAVFDRLIESQNQCRDKQVETLKDRLDELDRELSTLALSVEMHR
jgi:ribosomal protein L29